MMIHSPFLEEQDRIEMILLDFPELQNGKYYLLSG